jgi:hypothetical protein
MNPMRSLTRQAWVAALAVLAMALITPAFAEVILTESFDGPNGTLPTNWDADNNSGVIVSRRDNNELETEVVVAGNDATLAAYINDDDTDRGLWRDVDVVTTLRYNAGVTHGLVLRGQESSAVAIEDGDYYYVQVNGTTLNLFRVNNGVASGTLATDSTGDSFNTTFNRELRVQIANIADPDTDNVRIRAQIMETGGVTVLREIDFVDTSSSAITRAGTVGARGRVTESTATGQRATFDDLSVTATRPALLWYDDYYAGDAPRMQSFTSSASQDINNGKFRFFSIGGGGQGRATVDFDSHTATDEWENVRATTLMRWSTGTGNTNGRLEGGLILRETGMTSTSDGDYYYFALVRNESASAFVARIFRVIDGNTAEIATSGIVYSDIFPESTNLFLSFEAITNALGNVELEAIASLNANFSNPIATINFTDTNAARILGPGSAGFRVGGSSVSAATVNFDNFTVVAVPEPSSILVMIGLLLGIVRRRPAMVNVKQ